VHSFTAGLSTKIAMQIDSTVPMPYIAGFVADPTGTGAMLVARPGALVRNDVRPFSLNSQGITVTVSPGTRFLRDGTRVQLASATTAQVTSDGTFWVVHTAANAIVISPTLIQANPDDLVLGRVTRASGLINGLNMDDVLGGELVAGQNLADLTNPGTARTNIGLTRTVDTRATISAAGDTPWIVADNVANANATVQVDAPTTADGYLRTVTLQGDGTPNWITGAEATLTLNFAASSSGSARIEIRNMTAAGALLFAAAGHTGARAEVVRLVWNGTAWVSLTQGGVVPVALPGPTVSVVENALAGTPAGSIRWNGQNTKYAEAPIRGFPIGAGDYTVAVTVGLDVPGVGNGAIFALDGYPGGSLTPASAGGIYINVATGNYRLQYAVRNSSGSAVGSTSFDAAAYAGRVIQLALVRRAGVTDMFINGDLISISHPSTQAEPMVGDPLYLRIGAVGSGNASYPGRIFNARVFNRALTQANLKALAAFGVDSADRNAGGVFVSGALNNGDFEAWTTDGTAGSVNGSLPGWTIGAATGGCSVTRNVTDPIGGASSLLATTTIGNNIYWYPSNYAGVPQRRQRLSFKVQKLSGGSSPQIQITNTGVNTIITNLSLPTTAVVNYSVEYVCEGVAGQVRPALTHTSFQPAVTQVDDVVWESIGCLADIDCGVGLGYSLPDVQGRFPAQVIPSAYTDFVHSRPRREAQQIAYVATAGNIQIGALPANVRIRSIVADAASAVTLAVGTSSGGSQIVASVALVSGKQDLTIVGRFTSVPQQLWVNLSSAVAVILTVNFDLVS
jgi:hypothetical protein